METMDVAGRRRRPYPETLSTGSYKIGVTQETLLMIAGDVIQTGSRTVKHWLIVQLGLARMQQVGKKAKSMLSLMTVMMMLLTLEMVHCAGESFKLSLSGLSLSVT